MGVIQQRMVTKRKNQQMMPMPCDAQTIGSFSSCEDFIG
jgi:hypothetical protein